MEPQSTSPTLCGRPGLRANPVAPPPTEGGRSAYCQRPDHNRTPPPTPSAGTWRPKGGGSVAVEERSAERPGVTGDSEPR
jgi:hypothetical protein